MVSDETIHKAFRIHETLQTQPIRGFFFHYLPKLYIGFKNSLHYNQLQSALIAFPRFVKGC